MVCGLVSMLVLSFGASAQTRTVTVVLQDSGNGEPVGYATVSLTKPGATSASKYALSDDKGKATLEKVPAGAYLTLAMIHPTCLHLCTKLLSKARKGDAIHPEKSALFTIY